MNGADEVLVPNHTFRFRQLFSGAYKRWSSCAIIEVDMALSEDENVKRLVTLCAAGVAFDACDDEARKEYFHEKRHQARCLDVHIAQWK